MKLFSQRDVRWINTKLGTSNTTIGSHGCCITSIGMLADMEPPEVNLRLIGKGGFVNGNLVIWSKIKEAIPRLEFEWRGYTYDNNAVKSAIARFGGCLVEVNGAPIGGFRHWVVFIGNQRLYDPWDGKEKPTSVYSPTGFASIKVIKPPLIDKRQQVLGQIVTTINGPTSLDSKVSQVKYLVSTL